jgi:hypothetical protein
VALQHLRRDVRVQVALGGLSLGGTTPLLLELQPHRSQLLLHASEPLQRTVSHRHGVTKLCSDFVGSGGGRSCQCLL